jgi:hypothetical protein
MFIKHKKLLVIVLNKDRDQLNRSCEKSKELHRSKEDRNILHTIKKEDNWTGHILHSNCLLKHVTEGKVDGMIEVKERRGRRSKQLLDNLKAAFPKLFRDMLISIP